MVHGEAGAGREAGRAAASRAEHRDQGEQAEERDADGDGDRHAARGAVEPRGIHAEGDFTVASTVLVDRIRRALDELEHCAVLRVGLETDDEDDLAGVVLALSVEVPHPIAERSQQARTRTLAAVRAATGVSLDPEVILVDVMVADVHPAPPSLEP